VPAWIERHEQAKRHVEDGQRVVDRQRTLIARQKVLGHDTQMSERLLAAFERSQVIFESDLARIRAEQV
jgi:hypothetical protein